MTDRARRDAGAPAARQPDLTRPNAARIYDYVLGGNHNFAADRELADRMLEQLPFTRAVFAANRAFLARAVRYCVGVGHDQFLDLGAGIPSAGNVHEVARRLDPRARVAYVDNEPVAVEHGRSILAGQEGLSVTDADLRDPDAVLGAPTVTGVLDLDRPLVVLMVAVLHFVPHSDDVPGIVARYRDALAPGSTLVISHGSADQDDPADGHWGVAASEHYRNSANPIYLRDRATLRRIADGFELVDPGMVDIVRWRPDSDREARPVGAYAVVGTRP